RRRKVCRRAASVQSHRSARQARQDTQAPQTVELGDHPQAPARTALCAEVSPRIAMRGLRQAKWIKYLWSGSSWIATVNLLAKRGCRDESFVEEGALCGPT